MKTVSTSYETDFHAWTQLQAQALRSGATSELDRSNLAEEIESLGGRELREVYSRLIVLLTHLIKWECQPYDRSRSWVGTIKTQRRDLERIFKDSPSLRFYAGSIVAEAFDDALDQATDEMDYVTPLKQTFKTTYTFEQAMTSKLTL